MFAAGFYAREGTFMGVEKMGVEKMGMSVDKNLRGNCPNISQRKL